MISNAAYLQAIATLPPLMQKVVDNPNLVTAAETLEETHRLNGTQAKFMIELEASIIAKEFPPSAVSQQVKQGMNFDDDRAKSFSRDFLGLICLPMQWYIGNVEDLIRQLGGNVDQYLAEAKKRYPEVYQAAPAPTAAPVAPAPSAVVATKPTAQPSASSSLLDGLEERLTTFRGRAEVLLRMTALSQQVETAINAKVIDDSRGQALLQALDALSYAVNTQDLNPLEVQAIKRRLAKVVAETESLKQ